MRTYIILWVFLSIPISYIHTQEKSEVKEITEIVLGTANMVVSNKFGLRINIQDRGWYYELVKDEIRAYSGQITYAGIEESVTETQIIFQRLTEGKDTINLFRKDNNGEVLYKYVLRLDWSEYASIVNPIFKDRYIEVNSILPGEKTALKDDIVVEEKRYSEPEVKNTNNTIEENQSAQAPPNNTSSQITSTEKNKQSSLDIIDSVEMNNKSKSMEQKSKLPSSANQTSKVSSQNNATNNRKNNNTLSNKLEDSPADEAEKQEIVISQSSFEDMKKYIKEHYKTDGFDSVLNHIHEWDEEHDNELEAATLYWVFGKIIEGSLEAPKDIDNVLTVYQIIVDEFPLSYEYEDTLYLIEKLKERFVFVIK